MYEGFPWGSAVKNLPASAGGAETWFSPWVGRKWQLTPVFLPRKSHGQRSLAGYSPWGHKESDTTEHARIIMIVKGLKSLSVKVM